MVVAVSRSAQGSRHLDPSIYRPARTQRRRKAFPFFPLPSVLDARAYAFPGCEEALPGMTLLPFRSVQSGSPCAVLIRSCLLCPAKDFS